MAAPRSRIVVQINAFSPYRLWSLGESVPDRIARAFPNVRVVQSRDREAFVTFLPEATVLYTWSMPRRHLARAAKLRWIHTAEGGVDRLLSPELVKSKIVVTNCTGVTPDSVADHATGMVLSLSRRLAESRDLQRQRVWGRDLLWSGDRVPFALAGKTALVVGFGSIGSAIGRRLKACGMTVVGLRAKDADKTPPPEADEIHGPEALEPQLARADVVVLALPLTRETRRLFDGDRFGSFKPGALFVNVGRGEVVDDTALAEALASGRVGGAGLDVFNEEPLPRESPLWGHPRVVITPHVAGTDPGHMERATELFERNLERFLKDEPLLNVVDKNLGY